MPFKNLRQFIELLEKEGELIRIKTFVNPELEIAEVTDRVIKSNGKALLFENTGTNFPLLINAFGSEKRMAIALGVSSLDDIGDEMSRMFKEISSPKNSFLE